MEVMEVPVQIPDDVRAEIQEDYRGLVQCVVQESKTSMARGWYAAAIERKGGWEIVGYKHQHSCRVALGVSYSNWYRTMAVAQNFSRLNRETYMAMKLENAEFLGKQPEDVRYNPQNISDAATKSVREFKDGLTTVEAHASGHEKHEKWTIFEMKMKQAQREVIETNLRQWMAEHEIDSPAYALELLTTEATQGATFTGFMLEAIHKLTEVAQDTNADLREHLLDHIKAMSDTLLQCVGDDDASES